MCKMNRSGLLASARIEGLDIHKGLELYEGSVPVYLEVLRAFFIQGPRQIATMRDALELWDLPRYGIEAHALKSAARGLGAISLGALAAQQEAAGKGGNEEAVRQDAGRLLSDYQALLEALDASGLAREAIDPPDDTPVEPEALHKQIAFAAERAESYDLSALEETLRELLRHPLEPSLSRELRAVLDMSAQCLYEETQEALRALLADHF